MQTGVARNLLFELRGERRVMGGGEHLEEAEAQLGEPVRRAARLEFAVRVGIGLHVNERDAKAEALELRTRGVEVVDEVAGVIEEDLARLRDLPLGPAHAVSTVGQSTSSSGTIHVSFSAAVRHAAQAGSAIRASM